MLATIAQGGTGVPPWLLIVVAFISAGAGLGGAALSSDRNLAKERELEFTRALSSFYANALSAYYHWIEKEKFRTRAIDATDPQKRERFFGIAREEMKGLDECYNQYQAATVVLIQYGTSEVVKLVKKIASSWSPDIEPANRSFFKELRDNLESLRGQARVREFPGSWG